MLPITSAGGLAKMFEQNLIGLDDAVIGVVRQNDVVDGIEGIDPLPLRTQHLLEQAEVFDRDRQLLGAGLQKVKFFGGPLAAAGIAQQQQSDGRLVADDRDDHELTNLFGRETLLRARDRRRLRVVTCGSGCASSFEMSSLTAANPASRRKSAESPTA